jgi:tetratricopeptide (TPR) repeat protein
MVDGFQTPLIYCLLALTVALTCATTVPALIAAVVVVVSTLLPTAGIITHGLNQITCDRYGYLLHVALTPFLAGAINAWISNLQIMDQDAKIDAQRKQTRAKAKAQSSTASAFKIFTVASVSLCFLSLIAFHGRLTTELLEVWQNDLTLWEHNMKADPLDWRALDRKIEYLVKRQQSMASTGTVSSHDLEDVQPLLVRLLDIWPTHHVSYRSYNAKAKLYVYMQKLPQACELYDVALQEFGKQVSLLNNKGVCLSLLGNRHDEAQAHYEEALLMEHSNEKEALRMTAANLRGILQMKVTGSYYPQLIM